MPLSLTERASNLAVSFVVYFTSLPATFQFWIMSENINKGKNGKCLKFFEEIKSFMCLKEILCRGCSVLYSKLLKRFKNFICLNERGLQITIRKLWYVWLKLTTRKLLCRCYGELNPKLWQKQGEIFKIPNLL